MGDATVAMHVSLEEARLQALEMRRAALREEEKLLDTEERLARAGLRLWGLRAEQIHILRGAGTQEEGDSPPAEKRRKLGSLAALEAERNALHMTEANAAAQVLASCRKCRVQEAKLQDVEQEVKDEEWELRAVIRKHYQVPALQVPVEMLRKIFMMLSPDDRVSAGQVCSKWRDIIKHPAVWTDAKWDEYLFPATYSSSDSSDGEDKKKMAAKPKRKSRGSACRLLRAAPHLDEAEFWTRNHVNCFNESLKFRKINVQYVGKDTPAFLKSFNNEYTALKVDVRNHAVAKAIDMKCTNLKELFMSYQSGRPFIFRSRFVKRSSLKTLDCCKIPITTLHSILRGHQNTLENLTLRLPRFPDPSFELLGLESCARLNRLQVPCCLSFRLPPSCREVVLVLNRCDALAECRSCAALIACPGNVTHLKLCSNVNFVSKEDVTLPLERHLNFLGRDFLAPLQGVSIRLWSALSQAEVSQLNRAAGRELVFETTH